MSRIAAPLIDVAVAGLAVGAALAASLLFAPYLAPSFATVFFLAVVITSWTRGLRGGLTATVLAAFATEIFVFPPLYYVNLDLGSLLRFTMFALSAALMSAVAERRRLAQRQAEELAGARARLLEQEHAARSAAEDAECGSALLAEASRRLAASMDYPPALQGVTDLCVETIADACVIDLVDDEGAPRRAAASLARATAPEPASPSPLDGLDTPGHTAAADDRCVSAPIHAGGREVGALSVTFGGARPFRASSRAVVTDLAERIGRAIERALLYRDAREANRIKDEFLGTLSHELRTPLNAILGWIRLLRDGVVEPDRVDKALEVVERNAHAQLALINDLLDVSRIITGHVRLEPRELDLATVLETAVDSVRPSADAKAITLEVTVAPDVGLVSGDADRLHQVVWNLLSNAIKFTPGGGRVTAILERVDPHARITVRDTGRGIPPHFLPVVFDRFRQMESTANRTHGGAGLGLAIVRHLVELHGGTVQAESAGLGQGATFTVNLPIRAVRLGPAGAAAPDPASATAVQPLKDLRVLVVDDDADARGLVQNVLERAGAQVRLAASASEATTALDDARPDVLLCDIVMPEVDGYELIRRIRDRAAADGGRIPAVALTAYAGERDLRRVLLAGYQLHVGKPIDAGALVEAVAHVANSRLDD